MHVKTISTLALAGVIGATLVAPALAEASRSATTARRSAHRLRQSRA